jgi:hypothetical protein
MVLPSWGGEEGKEEGRAEGGGREECGKRKEKRERDSEGKRKMSLSLISPSFVFLAGTGGRSC